MVCFVRQGAGAYQADRRTLLIPAYKGDAVAPSLPQSIKGVIVNIKAIKLVKTCALFVAIGLGGCGGSGGEPTDVLAANCASGVAAKSLCTAITPATTTTTTASASLTLALTDQS